MHRLTRVAPLAVLTAAALLAGACSRRQEPAQAPTPVVNQDSIDAARRAEEMAAAERARRDSIAAAERARADSIARATEMRNRMMAEARNTLTAAIYFELDQSTLSEQSRSTLDSKLPLLNANPGMRIQVVGHADERGSDEYNLALGQRRAATAKRYLTDRGVASDRITVVSRGEEQPVCNTSDEGCWSQNRRDEFEIVAGGDAITVPNQ
jgi:peptidoglycan-associated lipoprotein